MRPIVQVVAASDNYLNAEGWSSPATSRMPGAGHKAISRGGLRRGLRSRAGLSNSCSGGPHHPCPKLVERTRSPTVGMNKGWLVSVATKGRCKEHDHANQTDLHRAAVGGGCRCGSDRRRTDGCRGKMCRTAREKFASRPAMFRSTTPVPPFSFIPTEEICRFCPAATAAFAAACADT